MPETLTVEDIIELASELIKKSEAENDRRFTQGKNFHEQRALTFSICPHCRKIHHTEAGTADCDCDMNDGE